MAPSHTLEPRYNEVQGDLYLFRYIQCMLSWVPTISMQRRKLPRSPLHRLSDHACDGSQIEDRCFACSGCPLPISFSARHSSKRICDARLFRTSQRTTSFSALAITLVPLLPSPRAPKNDVESLPYRVPLMTLARRLCLHGRPRLRHQLLRFLRCHQRQ